MLTSDDKVGGWVKKGQNHDDVILEWSLSRRQVWNLIKNFKICTDVPPNGIKELFHQLQNGEIEVMGSIPNAL